MAEIWGAAIAAGTALAGAAASAKGAKDASRAAQAGADAATAEQRRQYDQSRLDNEPYRVMGAQALNALGRIYGYGSGVPAVGNTTPAPGNALARPNGVDPSSGYRVGPGGSIRQGITIDNATGQPVDQVPATFGGTIRNVVAGTAGGVPEQYPVGATAAGPPMMAGPDYSNFFASPDYTFRRDEGTRGIERSAAAAGLTGSGNALAALADYNSNLAAGEFGNYFNRQAALAGIGQSAVNTTTTAGMNSANNIGAALQNGANARASGIGDAADAWGNALGTIGGIAYDRWGRPKKGN